MNPDRASSWSSIQYSSTPSILSIEEEVVYPWEIDVAVSSLSDVQKCKLARTKTTMRLKTIPELMAVGYSTGNSHYASDSFRWIVEVCSTSSNPSEWRGEPILQLLTPQSLQPRGLGRVILQSYRRRYALPEHLDILEMGWTRTFPT